MVDVPYVVLVDVFLSQMKSLNFLGSRQFPAKCWRVLVGLDKFRSISAASLLQSLTISVLA
jgi:hypothetical protein